MAQHVCVQSSRWWRADWVAVRLCPCDHISLLRTRGQRSNPASASLQPINLALIEMHGSMIFDSDLQIGEREWKSGGKLGLPLGICHNTRPLTRHQRHPEISAEKFEFSSGKSSLMIVCWSSAYKHFLLLLQVLGVGVSVRLLCKWIQVILLLVWIMCHVMTITGEYWHKEIISFEKVQAAVLSVFGSSGPLWTSWIWSIYPLLFSNWSDCLLG